MSKKIIIGISILLLLIMVSVHISYAIDSHNEKVFFKVNKEEISPEETLEMIFDISSLEYNKFKILLNSNIDSDDIYTKDKADITVEDNENAISIEVDKDKMSLNQITLYYPIPKEMAIGTKIQFTAQIIVNNETNKEIEISNRIDNIITNKTEFQKEKSSNNIENLEIESKSKSVNKNEIVKKITKIITVVEKATGDDKKEDNKPNENDNKQTNDSKTTDTEKENNFKQEQNNNEISDNSVNNQKISISGNISSSLSESSTDTGNQAIYNGSNNNYLSKLEIEGIELNTSFNKENGTYFINTNNTNDINITAIAEDSTAKIYITGHDNIQKGNNKILISVTAENGNVRYYRVFVIFEEGTDET